MTAINKFLHVLLVAFCCSQTYCASTSQKHAIQAGLNALRNINLHIKNQYFNTFIGKLCAIYSPSMNSMSGLLKFKSSRPTGADEMTFKSLSNKFNEVNRQLDVPTRGFEGVRKQIDWSVVQVSYGEYERIIKASMLNIEEILNAPYNVMENRMNHFIIKYESDFRNAAAKIWNGMVSEGTFLTNILSAAHKYTEDVKKVQTFGLGVMQLLLQGVEVEVAYTQMKYKDDSTTKYVKVLWEQRMERLKTKLSVYVTPAELESIPFHSSMSLGRGFNINSYKTGPQIFSEIDFNNPLIESNSDNVGWTYTLAVESEEYRNYLKFRLINDELTLKLKTNQSQYGGPQRYFVESVNRDLMVEFFYGYKFQTVKKSINPSAIPQNDCSGLDPEDYVTHYIRSMQYGGIVVGSLRFKTRNKAVKEAVFKALSDSWHWKTPIDVAKFKQITRHFSHLFHIDRATLYGTSLPERRFKTAEDLFSGFSEYKTKLTQLNNKMGVIYEVELFPVDQLSGCQHKEPIIWRRNKKLKTNVNDLEEKLDDIGITRAEFNSWKNKLDLDNIKESSRLKIKDFGAKLSEIYSVFNNTVAHLDVSEDSDVTQFDAAVKMYSGGSGDAIGNKKYQKKLAQLQENV